MLIATSAQAQSDDIGSAIVGGFLKGIQSGVAATAWGGVDQPTRACLASQFNIDVGNLISQGVLPSDPSVAPDIQSCRTGAAPPADQSQQASLAPAQNKPDRGELVKRFGRKAADLILAGQIAKGMSEDEVELAWGEPSARDTVSAARESWDYGNDHVLFIHGRVSDVSH